MWETLHAVDNISLCDYGIGFKFTDKNRVKSDLRGTDTNRVKPSPCRLHVLKTNVCLFRETIKWPGTVQAELNCDASSKPSISPGHVKRVGSRQRSPHNHSDCYSEWSYRRDGGERVRDSRGVGCGKFKETWPSSPHCNTHTQHEADLSSKITFIRSPGRLFSE